MSEQGIEEVSCRIQPPDDDGKRVVVVERRFSLYDDTPDDAIRLIRQSTKGLREPKVTSACHGDGCWSRYIEVSGTRDITPEELRDIEKDEQWRREQKEREATQTIETLRKLYPHLFKDKPNETTQA